VILQQPCREGKGSNAYCLATACYASIAPTAARRNPAQSSSGFYRLLLFARRLYRSRRLTGGVGGCDAPGIRPLVIYPIANFTLRK
jgi:hypothetical protein